MSTNRVPQHTQHGVLRGGLALIVNHLNTKQQQQSKLLQATIFEAQTSKLPQQHHASSKPITKCKCPVLCDNSAGGALAYKCLWHIQSALWHSRAQIAN